MGEWASAARTAVERCRVLSRYTEEPGRITRTYLSAPMKDVHAAVGGWLRGAGCAVGIDAVGNIRGRKGAGPAFLIGSHLDTVPDAGAFDGILGVMMGLALLEQLTLPYALELIGFAEEEGVRYGVPFLGSRALAGTLDASLIERISPAIRQFGLDPARIPEARLSAAARGYLEFHIEQGPVLEHLGQPLGVVEGIAGQSRLLLRFEGKANHAGTTPMRLRRDALAGAAEWIVAVERIAGETSGLVATVGRIEVEPGAGNVIPGAAHASLDVRHIGDEPRRRAVCAILEAAESIAQRRSLALRTEPRLEQNAVAMDAGLTAQLSRAAGAAHCMPSGAGHDAMILAPLMPSAMLFMRSPGGISHHPDEAVNVDDVEAALACGARFLAALEEPNA